MIYPVRESDEMTRRYTQIESPLGPLLMVADDAGLREILFVNGRHQAQPESSWIEDQAPFAEAVLQLQAYFAGELENFNLQLAPEGTPFQLGVWQRLCDIPYGKTISYGELAGRIGNPKASRAVGLANGSNPIPIVIPCHRVVNKSGALGGYGGGLRRKQFLLDLERSAAK